MPLRSEPASLETQAIRAIGTVVSQTFSRLLEAGNSTSLFEIVSTCKTLKSVIHCNIPHVLANPVTNHLLRRLDDCQSFRREVLTHSHCRKLIQLFVRAILSPEVTVLEITWQWRFIGDFVHLEMKHLSNLKVLKLCDSECFDGDKTAFGISKYVKKFVHLEELTLQSKCTDEILKAVGRYCLKLRHLDINGSVRITDESVRTIISFDYLQSLDVTHTGLTDAGRTQILLGLSRKEKNSLKSYACNHICNSEINVLVNKFPNLNSLSVRFINININLEIFQNFKNLQVFKTANYMQHFHRELIPFLGTNLVELQLVGYTMNVPNLAENCPVLTRLTLKMDSIQTGLELNPTFSKLKHLTLVTNDSLGTAFFLTCCPNLTSLQLVTVPEFYTQFHLEMVVLKNPLKYLRELSVGSVSKDLPPSTLWFIAIHWDLVSCKVLLENSKRSGQYKEFPGIQVDCDLWLKINERVHFTEIRRKPKKQNLNKGMRRRLYRYAKN